MRLLLGVLFLLLAQLPARAGPDDLAVIIANKRYDFAHTVEYADRDGEAMRDFAERALAIPRDRILLVQDASLARLRTLFGTAMRPGEIAGRLAGRKAQRVWIYYSGHGVPGKRADGGFEPYLLPKDANPQQPEHSAMPLDEIEASVRAAIAAHAKGAQMVLILDACFSGRSEADTAVADAKGRVLSPESSAGGPVRLVPRKASDELIVLAAARDDEIASWDRDARHGLFTELLLQAFFNGTGEGKTVTVGAIEKFLAARTNERLSALFPAGGRMQRPELRGPRSVVLVDNAGTITRDEAARRQATVLCNGLRHSPDAKAIGDFLSSPLCARGCDEACRSALGERRRTLEREAAECVDVAKGLDALIKQKQPKSVLEAALKDVPARCTVARSQVAAAIAALEPPPAPVAPAPKAPVQTGTSSGAPSTTPAPAPIGAGYVATIVSKKTRMEALSALADLQQKHPSVLQGKTATVQEANLGDKGFWYRVIVGPPGSREAAANVCSQLKGQGFGGCWTHVASIEQANGVGGADPALSVVPGSGQTFRDCYDADPVKNRICPEMVVVPAGSFLMGSSAQEIAALTKEYPLGKSGWRTEGPQRVVRFERAFAVGKFEVTFEEWDACHSAGGCTYRPQDEGWGRGRQPVINVSWEDAKQYVSWLSKFSGKSYRLLSEAEWEYVARAKSTTPYHFGGNDAELGNHAWFQSNGGGRTHPVGGRQPNAWGLFDIHGNVWEWVEDCWNDSYKGAPGDGRARTAECTDSPRVVRGGGWDDTSLQQRASNRWRFPPYGRNNSIGFRLARVIDAAPSAPPQQSGPAPVPAHPKAADTAPKSPAVDPKRPAAGADTAGADPARLVAPGSGAFFRDRLADGSDCAFCPKLVVVPAGEFAMGSTEAEIRTLIRGSKDEQPISERPQHTVSIAKAFAVGRHEVTLTEWGACVVADVCRPWAMLPGWTGEHPVVNVSWDEAKQFVDWLSSATGKQYRLLSEAEWEYAARARRKTMGSVQTDLEAWGAKSAGGRAQPVGTKRANRWGLHDMLGNVSEWVEDCWNGIYTGAPTDGSAWVDGACSARVRRGGSFEDGPLQLRPAYRIANSPDVRSPSVGFRVAREIEP